MITELRGSLGLPTGFYRGPLASSPSTSESSHREVVVPDSILKRTETEMKNFLTGFGA